MELSLPLILSLRLTVPLIILKFPLIGVLASIHLDNIDWFYFNVTNESQYVLYQIADKLLDTYFLAFALIIAWGWKDLAAKKIAIYAFFWRLLGTLLYFLTYKESLLILFPNYFETFFVFYLLFRLFERKQNLFTSKKSYWVILPLLLIPKLIHELIHLPPSLEIPYFEQFKDEIILFSYLIFLSVALIWRLRQKGISVK